MSSDHPAEALTNDGVRHELGLRVARILGAEDGNNPVECGQLTIHHFSFTFTVNTHPDTESGEVFVKIPKTDMRGTEPQILPISSEDRALAQGEVSSLRLLGEKWPCDELGVRWVHIRDFLPEHNAIITDRVFGGPAFQTFRRLDILRRCGFRKAAGDLRGYMARLGAALGRFHHANSRPLPFRFASLRPKLESYCRDISERTDSPWPRRVLDRLRHLGDIELPGLQVPTLKGLDIRNILLDSMDRMYLLDPGKMKVTYREADLARFLMTYRILYWGSKCLLLLGTPDAEAEASFLSSYYKHSSPPSQGILDFYFLKEMLKHWYTAMDSLQRLPWTPAVKRLTSRIYIDPFYSGQLAMGLGSVSLHKRS